MKVTVPPYVHTQPAPVVLIGCGTVDRPNLITCAWFGTVCSEPPMVSVSIRPERYSYPLIMETGEFTANLPRIDDLDAVKLCGSESGKDVDKFNALGWEAKECPPLEHAPMAPECFLSMACKVKHDIDLGTHRVFIAEIVGIHSRDRYVRPSGRVNPLSKEQLVYLDGRYWGLHPAED